MTLADQERLDDPGLLEAADPVGVLRQVASAAAQVRTSARITAETDLSQVISAGRPRSIVVTGMGGSGVAGEVLAAVCGPGSATAVVTQHDYGLPGWVGAADLVIAVSCSGATEETLSAAAEAVRRGCPLLGVGGAGSPLAHVAEQARAPFIPVQPAGMPRFTLWGLAVPLMVVADRLGVADDPGGRARGCRRRPGAGLPPLPPGQRIVRQPGQDAGPGAGRHAADDLGQLAADRGGGHPVRLPAEREREVPGDAGECCRRPTTTRWWCSTVPFAPWPAAGPAVLGDEDPRPAVPLRLVILRDSQEHPQVSRRREVSAELAEQHGIGVSELAADGETALQRLASLIQLIDYATVYLGIAIGVDPGPIAVIGDLKERIA